MFEGDILLNSSLLKQKFLVIQHGRARQSEDELLSNKGFAMIHRTGSNQNFYCVFFDRLYILAYSNGAIAALMAFISFF